MQTKFKAILKRALENPWFKTAIIVAMTYVLTSVLLSPFAFSLGAIGAKTGTDFRITDLYHSVADSRDVRDLSSDIVLVDVTNSDRNEIAESINLLNMCEPKVIGLDIIFKEERGDDEPLIEAIKRCENIVLVQGLRQTDKKSEFVVEDCSYFMPLIQDAQVGIVNFPTSEEGGFIRNFPVEFSIMGYQQKMPSFVTALASIYNPDAVTALKKRGSQEEIIYFPSVEFPVIHAVDIFDHKDELKGKIVILGAVNDLSDLHPTPLSPRMPGLFIQAYSLNTILKGDYLSLTPHWAESLIAFLIAAIFIYINVTTNVWVKGLLLRILQIATLYIVLQAGYWFFIEKGIIIDFSRSFLMLAFALFSCDIWNGVYYLALKSRKKWMGWKNRKLNKTNIITIQ